MAIPSPRPLLPPGGGGARRRAEHKAARCESRARETPELRNLGCDRQRRGKQCAGKRGLSILGRSVPPQVLAFRDIHSRKAAAMNRTPGLELDLDLELAAGRKAPDQRQARLEEEQEAGRRAVEAAKDAAARYPFQTGSS